ncbi:MAG: DEAD/DEAH box helicase, partial [Chloroflexi bacterium]|nr:DEAD/DEAH box helicase [Chloroflexota bacterium]
DRLFEAKDAWALDRDAELGLLAVEARRIKGGGQFDKYHEIFSSAIEPLPHQAEAVFNWMLGRYPLRVLLADDPGAGKTITAGLLIRQMAARDLVRRCIIIVPGNLAEQWKTELLEKFGLRFEIVERDDIANTNPFTLRNRVIISMDRAKREEYLKKLRESPRWDLIVCDEAHKMSVSVIGNNVGNITARYRLGLALRELTTNYLLMTATPHTGNREEFRWFMRLLDRDRFEKPGPRFDVSDLYLRRMKEQLVTREQTALFPDRVSYTAKYNISQPELDLYEAVTSYCRHEFGRAYQLEGRRRNTVGFALTILQRRLASSPEAIYRSLQSRRQRLTALLEESLTRISHFDFEIDWDEFEDLPAHEREEIEREVVSLASAARSLPELQREIETLENLEQQANVLRNSEVDSKWEELRDIWENRLPTMERDGNPRKLIIFSEHRATLSYLSRKLRTLLGSEKAVVTIDGGLNSTQRRRVQDDFQHDARVQVLVATDAAGEGINLQFAHLMVNYDLPWNPNRLEQRFGRIHRIGQNEVCHLFNLVIGNTREDAVYRLLAEKLETIGNDLNGAIYDILGELFHEKPLREIVEESLRYGDDPARQRESEQRIESTLDINRIRELEQRRIADRSDFDANRTLEEMQETAAGRLQKEDAKRLVISTFHYISRNCASRVADIRELGDSKYEIRKMPGVVVEFARTHGFGHVEDNYRSICFDRDLMHRPDGRIGSELIHSEHPLLKATVGWVLSQWQSERGDCGDAYPVLIDERSEVTCMRLVYLVEWTVQNDFQRELDRRQVLSHEAQFVQAEISDSYQNFTALGSSPELYHRPATAADMQSLHAHLEHDLLDVESSASFIDEQTYELVIAPKLDAIKSRESTRINLERREVLRSLSAQIEHEIDQFKHFKRLAEENPDYAALHRANADRHDDNRIKYEARKMYRERNWKLEQQITVSAMNPRRVAVIVPASLMR